MPPEHVEQLKRDIMALESRRETPCFLPLGCAPIDSALQGGLELGALHEIGGPAAGLYALFFLKLRQGPVLWIAQAASIDALNPAGLAFFGFDPARLLHLAPSGRQACLAAAYEALCSRAPGAVIADLDRPLSLDEARKLQLAAHEGGSLALVLDRRRGGGPGLVSAAVTRWSVSLSACAPAGTCFRLALTRNRRGAPGAWTVEWSHATDDLYLVSPAAGRTPHARQPALA